MRGAQACGNRLRHAIDAAKQRMRVLNCIYDLGIRERRQARAVGNRIQKHLQAAARVLARGIGVVKRRGQQRARHIVDIRGKRGALQPVPHARVICVRRRKDLRNAFRIQCNALFALRGRRSEQAAAVCHRLGTIIEAIAVNHAFRQVKGVFDLGSVKLAAHLGNLLVTRQRMDRSADGTARSKAFVTRSGIANDNQRLRKPRLNAQVGIAKSAAARQRFQELDRIAVRLFQIRKSVGVTHDYAAFPTLEQTTSNHAQRCLRERRRAPHQVKRGRTRTGIDGQRRQRIARNAACERASKIVNRRSRRRIQQHRHALSRLHATTKRLGGGGEILAIARRQTGKCRFVAAFVKRNRQAPRVGHAAQRQRTAQARAAIAGRVLRQVANFCGSLRLDNAGRQAQLRNLRQLHVGEHAKLVFGNGCLLQQQGKRAQRLLGGFDVVLIGAQSGNSGGKLDAKRPEARRPSVHGGVMRRQGGGVAFAFDVSRVLGCPNQLDFIVGSRCRRSNGSGRLIRTRK